MANTVWVLDEQDYNGGVMGIYSSEAKAHAARSKEIAVRLGQLSTPYLMAQHEQNLVVREVQLDVDNTCC